MTPASLPDTTGLPIWAQILVSLLICIGALGAAFSGYFKKSPSAEATPAQVGLAALVEHGAIRHNSDALVNLSAVVLALTATIEESTHYSRNEVDLLREMCKVLESLRAELERQGRERRGWDNRNEDRRDETRRID